MYMYVRTYVHVRMYLCACPYIRTYVCMYVCMNYECMYECMLMLMIPCAVLSICICSNITSRTYCSVVIIELLLLICVFDTR